MPSRLGGYIGKAVTRVPLFQLLSVTSWIMVCALLYCTPYRYDACGYFSVIVDISFIEPLFTQVRSAHDGVGALVGSSVGECEGAALGSCYQAVQRSTKQL